MMLLVIIFCGVIRVQEILMYQQTYKQKLSKISPQKMQKWKKQQNYVKQLISFTDSLKQSVQNIRLVGGVDISFSSKFDNGACAGLIIYDTSYRKIVYEDYIYVKLKQQYIPGFLAFRQLGPTLQLFNRLKSSKPQLWPQVIMADGNGILHKRQCGYACHLGVLLKTPTFGCAKSFFDVDGLHQSQVVEYLRQKLDYHGDYVTIKGKSGRDWCTAILSDQKQDKYSYVSVGTMISLQSATKLTLKLLRYQVPEPIRLADKRTREQIKKMNKQDYQKAKSYDMIFLTN